MKIVCTSLFADPLHKGHIEVLQKSKEQGDFLIVLVDSDEKAIQKKGFVFLPLEDRIAIIRELKCVDVVIPLYTSVADALAILQPDCFCKGGDRTIDNLPIEEIEVCKKYGIKIICGLGDKIQASSSILENFYQNYKKIKDKFYE